MTYGSGSLEYGKELYNEAVNDIGSGRDDSARSKLQQAQQIFELCRGTDSEADDWLRKTNQKLGEIES
jgi:hypothetical protein